ncbi:MAG: M56 family metallopeptidase, partial [Verrucomicrobiaceae bacterium]
MSVYSTYLLNVALHGSVLSIFATGLLVLLRRPGQRSFVAISGLLAVGVLPWMTALRPERRVSEPVAEIQAQPVSPALPLWTVVTLPMPEDKFVVDDSEPVADAPPFVLPDALTCIVFTWAAGTAAGILLLAGATLKVCSWRRSLRPLDDETWQTVTFLSPDIPGRHLFLLSASATSPCVTGFFRPRIVLPSFLLENEAEQQLRWAVGHELAHLRAGDSRWMIVFSLIRCMNWWNPFVHLLISRWAEAREQLCDLHATGLSEDRPDYGKFLIAMACRITGRPPLAVAMAKRAHANRLKQRITHLLDSRPDTTTPLGKSFIGTGAVLTLMATLLVSILKIQADVPRGRTDTTSEGEAIPEPVAPQDTAEDPTDETTIPLPNSAPPAPEWP